MRRLAAAASFIAASAAAASAPVQPELLPIDVQLQQARSDFAAATAEQHRLEAVAAQARGEADRLGAEQLAAAQAIVAAEAQISAADVQARTVAARLVVQRQRLAIEQAPVSSLLGGLALMARRPPLLLLADSRSPEELVKLRLLLRATVPVIQARSSALASELNLTSRLERQASSARDDMVRSRNELARRRAAFARLEAKALQLAESLGSDALGAGDVVIASDEQLGALQQQSQSAASARPLALDLARLGPAALLRGEQGPAAPLDYMLPARAQVTDGVGEVSANGVRSRGITLATRRGAQLLAPAAGTIVFAGPFGDYDGVIIIDHGQGWTTILVKAGTRRGKGARIRIGEPLGIALGPVEVQLQHDGQPVSPALIAGSSAVLSNPRKGG